MMDLIIYNFLDYEFVYVFLLCFLVFLLISIFVRQKFIRKISILLFSIFFILFVFEISLSLFMQKPEMDRKEIYIQPINNKEIIEYKENRILIDNKYLNVNVKFINRYTDYSVIYENKYSIYNNGFRVTECNYNSDETFIFFGCSFVFGVSIRDDECLPYYFSKKFNFEKNIINCGVPGQSINTILNILDNEVYLPLIKNKNSKIKNCFYSLIYDHIYRNFRYEHSNVGVGDGYLYKSEKWYIPTVVGKIKYIFARSYIFRKIFVTFVNKCFKKYYEDYMISSLKRMEKIIEEKYNSKLTIIVWDKNEYSEYFINKLKESNLDLIFLPDKFASEEDGYRIKDDGHPTAKANEEIAEILYNHINIINILKEN